MFYAVKVGRNPGIYNSWDECKNETQGYSGAVFKKFKTKSEAEAFMEGSLSNSSNYSNSPNSSSSIKDMDEIKDFEIVSYVDGSYRREDHSYSYGVYLFDGNIEEKYSKRFFDPENAKSRNVSGELRGAMVAISRALQLGKKKIYLHYDYMGICDWALGNWKANLPLTITYKKFYDSIKDKIEVIFIKVDAHTGVYYNELVDKLAKEAK